MSRHFRLSSELSGAIAKKVLIVRILYAIKKSSKTHYIENFLI